MEVKCNICGKCFATITSLSSHYYNDHSAYHHCQYCYAQFHSISEVKNHAEKIHISKAFFPCFWCEHESNQKKVLAGHRRERHVQALRENSCSYCSLVFVNKEILKLHNQFCHGYKVNSSETKVAHPNSFNPMANMSALLPPKKIPDSSSSSPSFRCQFCPKQFITRAEHCLHSIRQHNAYLLCSYCDKHFEKSESYESHLVRTHKIKKSWTCVYCWIAFNDRTLLKAHQTLAKHDVVSCPVCKTLMPSHDCLMVHREFESNSAKNEQHSRPSTSIGDGDSNLLLCLACFQRVPSNQFSNHASEHINKDGTPLSCNECFCLLTWSKNLRSHDSCFRKEALRTVRNDLVCNECGYKCDCRKQLARHIGWCHKPMMCRYCSTQCIGHVGQKVHSVRHGYSLWQSHDQNESKIRISDDKEPPVESFTSEKSTHAKTPTETVKKQSKIKSPEKFEAPRSSPNFEKAKSKVELISKIKSEPESEDEEEVTVIRKHHKPCSLIEIDNEKNSSAASSNESDTTKFARRLNKLKDELSLSSSDVESFVTPSKRQRKRKNDSNDESSSEETKKKTKKLLSNNEPAAASTPIVSMAPKIKRLDQRELFANEPLKASATQANLKAVQSVDPKMKDATLKTEFVCTLCGKFSDYKNNIRRHVFNVHRIPMDVVVEFCQERDKLPPPIVIPPEKKFPEGRNVASQTTLVCLECTQKDKKIRRLKTLLKHFMNAATEMKTVLGDND